MCLLAVTTLAFDIAALEVFLPLLVGARVVLVSRAEAADGQQLLQVLADHAGHGDASHPGHLAPAAGGRVGREPARSRSCVAAKPCRGSWRSSCWHGRQRCGTSMVRRKPPSGRRWVGWSRETGRCPLGRPIANTQLYVLDRHLQPGAHRDAGRTLYRRDRRSAGLSSTVRLDGRALFAATPSATASAARLYKTGDLARYRAMGALEFLGRLDQQVKLRGFRIELGEIEAVLSQHPGVRQAVVVAPGGAPSGHTPGGLYRPASRPRAHWLARCAIFLHAQLPDYMVPAAFVLLDTLPLTPNGKVDRRALPAPDHARARAKTALVAPRTPTEAKLAGLWADVLQLERVGVHDNFFALGGHSLLATQVMARIGTTFQVELPLRTLFEAPTVADLAERLETGPAGRMSG